ncbi:MAG: type II secretion system protein GspG [Planctomycetota bacterium]|jgi:hypothetical protein
MRPTRKFTAFWMLALLVTGFAAGRHWPAEDRGAATPPRRPLEGEVRRLEREITDLKAEREWGRPGAPLLVAGRSARGPAGGKGGECKVPDETNWVKTVQFATALNSGGPVKTTDNKGRLALYRVADKVDVDKVFVQSFTLEVKDFQIATYSALSTASPRDVEDEKKKSARARGKVNGLARAVKQFRKDQGRLPHTLLELTLPFEGKPNGYVKDVPLDPWANQYLYDPGGDGKSFRVLSPGPDGREGTKDDLLAK